MSCISQGSLEKQNQQSVCAYIETYILRNLLMQLWRLGKYKICRIGQQVERSGEELMLQFKSEGCLLAECLPAQEKSVFLAMSPSVIAHNGDHTNHVE